MRRVISVTLVGLVLGTALVATSAANQSRHCCGSTPYASIFRQARPLSSLDTMLAKGDGQAFAAIAEDPLLRRPDVLATPAVFAYRAQRPVWAYVAWAASGGQADIVGVVLALLTILSVGAACAVTAVFLLERGLSHWWALLVPLFGLETIRELTPELLAFALLGLGIILWQRERRVTGAVAFSVAALTRETMLVGVAALGLWYLYQHRADLAMGFRRGTMLAVPCAVYITWIAYVRVRVGAWPSEGSQGRLTLPLAGLTDALVGHDGAARLLPWLTIGLVFTIGAMVLARSDLLTWITIAFFGLASTLSTDTWGIDMGFVRTLLPMFVFGGIAFATGIRASTARRVGAAEVDVVRA